MRGQPISQASAALATCVAAFGGHARAIRLLVALSFVAVSIVLIVGCQGLSTVQQRLVQNPIPPSVANVPARDLRVSGTIEADDVFVSSELVGRIVELHADEGDAVTAGQVLAQLDTTSLDAKIQQAQAAVQTAKANLAAVKESASPQEIQVAESAVEIAEQGVAAAEKGVEIARGNVDAAKATLAAVEADQARLKAGADPFELARAEEQIQLARDQLRAAWSVRDSTGGSEDRGEIPEGSYEAAKAAVAQAEIQVRIAELRLEVLKAGARSEELLAAAAAVEAAQAGVDAAESQVVEAQKQLETARMQLREAQAGLRLLQAGATDEEIAIAEADVGKAEAAVKILEIQRDQARLRAPRDGLVLERAVNPGETVAPGSILFRLANLDRVSLVAYIPENELDRAYVGQSVDVKVAALPGQSFQGRVVRMAPRAEFTPRNTVAGGQETNRVFAVKIELPNPNGVFKPGMSADAVFGD